MQKLSKSEFAFILILLPGISIYSQQIDFKADFEKIKTKLSEPMPDPYKRSYIYKDEKSLIKKLNPINNLYGGALYVYQNVVSKQISSNCIYNPSCSEFSKNAIKEYGLFKGLVLSTDRIYRCNAFAARDLKNRIRDPVTNRYSDPVSKYKRIRKTRHVGLD